MILSTARRRRRRLARPRTPQIEGHTIREYKGIVTGETIIGANMFKDLFAGIRDIASRGYLSHSSRQPKYLSQRLVQERKNGDNYLIIIGLNCKSLMRRSSKNNRVLFGEYG